LIAWARIWLLFNSFSEIFNTSIITSSKHFLLFWGTILDTMGSISNTVNGVSTMIDNLPNGSVEDAKVQLFISAKLTKEHDLVLKTLRLLVADLCQQFKGGHPG
jgi:hypothetical protein